MANRLGPDDLVVIAGGGISGLALAAALLGVLCGLIGSVGHLLLLAPTRLLLSLGLLPLCLALAVCEGEGEALTREVT